MQLAYADREKYLGDSDFVDVPVKGLLDPAYLAERSALIDPRQGAHRLSGGKSAGLRAPHGRDFGRSQRHDTFLSSRCRKGNIANMTSTIESRIWQSADRRRVSS